MKSTTNVSISNTISSNFPKSVASFIDNMWSNKRSKSSKLRLINLSPTQLALLKALAKSSDKFEVEHKELDDCSTSFVVFSRGAASSFQRSNFIPKGPVLDLQNLDVFCLDLFKCRSVMLGQFLTGIQSVLLTSERDYVNDHKYRNANHCIRNALVNTSLYIATIDGSISSNWFYGPEIKTIANATRKIHGIGNFVASLLQSNLRTLESADVNPPSSGYSKLFQIIAPALMIILSKADELASGSRTLIGRRNKMSWDEIVFHAKPYVQECLDPIWIPQLNRDECFAQRSTNILTTSGFIRKCTMDHKAAYSLEDLGFLWVETFLKANQLRVRICTSSELALGGHTEDDEQKYLVILHDEEMNQWNKSEKTHPWDPVVDPVLRSGQVRSISRPQMYFHPGHMYENGVVLLVDTRELGGDSYHLCVIEEQLKVRKIRFETRKIPCGDYLWILRKDGEEFVFPMLCERKRYDDLAQSLSRGRHAIQKKRMIDCSSKLWDSDVKSRLTYIIEGSIHVYRDAIYLAGSSVGEVIEEIQNLKDQNFVVEPCEEVVNTVEYLVTQTQKFVEEIASGCEITALYGDYCQASRGHFESLAEAPLRKEKGVEDYQEVISLSKHRRACALKNSKITDYFSYRKGQKNCSTTMGKEQQHRHKFDSESLFGNDNAYSLENSSSHSSDSIVTVD